MTIDLFSRVALILLWVLAFATPVGDYKSLLLDTGPWPSLPIARHDSYPQIPYVRVLAPKLTARYALSTSLVYSAPIKVGKAKKSRANHREATPVFSSIMGRANNYSIELASLTKIIDSTISFLIEAPVIAHTEPPVSLSQPVGYRGGLVRLVPGVHPALLCRRFKSVVIRFAFTSCLVISIIVGLLAHPHAPCYVLDSDPNPVAPSVCNDSQNAAPTTLELLPPLVFSPLSTDFIYLSLPVFPPLPSEFLLPQLVFTPLSDELLDLPLFAHAPEPPDESPPPIDLDSSFLEPARVPLPSITDDERVALDLPIVEYSSVPVDVVPALSAGIDAKNRAEGTTDMNDTSTGGKTLEPEVSTSSTGKSSLCEYFEFYRPPNLANYPPEDRARVKEREIRLAKKVQTKCRREDAKEGREERQQVSPYMAVWMEMLKHGCIPAGGEGSEGCEVKSIARWKDDAQGRAKVTKGVRWRDEV
ncbi:hypothetical protein RhiXN_07937 [Rhizoctonia solani]|uniref:Uncharacterized protein n=1 Tax=Rhizoctonia solani TaxID=456999 RepID=A0A8H8SY73_9AGAM|nr:uncharacterized protein RhiXN_07937 [Rhizoctonia solani]QRW22901.1 hypothetical protein RhiXN_07937 [Rhizoctonia solani]